MTSTTATPSGARTARTAARNGTGSGTCASTLAFVRQVHREGQVLQVWVVNDEADIIRLLEWGVDGVISDRPDVAVRATAAWYKKRQ